MSSNAEMPIGRVFPCPLGMWLMAVPLFLQPCVQLLEGCLQVLPVLFLGDPIHSYRRIGTLTAIGSLES